MCQVIIKIILTVIVSWISLFCLIRIWTHDIDIMGWLATLSKTIPVKESAGTQKTSQFINLSPAVKTEISLDKKITLENIGVVGLKEIELSIFKYVFDEKDFPATFKIKNFVKIGNIKLSPLSAGTKSKSFDISTFGEFYDNPGKDQSEFATILTTHYCITITFRNNISGEKFGCFTVTSAMKGEWKAPYEKDVSYYGGKYGDLFLKTKQFIFEHQKKLTGDEFKIISCE